jgi:hypothetical protein
LKDIQLKAHLFPLLTAVLTLAPWAVQHLTWRKNAKQNEMLAFGLLEL